MTIIKIDPVATTSLLSATTTTESTVDNEEDASTTALIACSTLTTSMPSAYVHAESAQKYIDSLNDTQLVEMEKLLIEKENVINMNISSEKEIETQKVYKKL